MSLTDDMGTEDSVPIEVYLKILQGNKPLEVKNEKNKKRLYKRIDRK